MSKVGNSQALFIPQAILELLGWTMSTDLAITTDGIGLHIIRADDHSDRAKALRANTDKVLAKAGRAAR